MSHLLAYIDPGTGSFILQAAIGAIMGVSYAFRNHTRSLINKLRRKDKSPEAPKDQSKEPQQSAGTEQSGEPKQPKDQ